MKKALVILIVGLLCVIASGCGSSQATSDSASQQSEPETQATWNTEDMDIASNGNVSIAIDFINRTDNPTQIVDAGTPVEAFKAPWKYYGKIVAVTGPVAIIQEYPPGSDLYNLVGGDCGEIVLLTDDGTYVDYLHIGSTGSTKLGDLVTLYGTPAGQVTADNKLGGQTTELFMVGKTIETVPAQ